MSESQTDTVTERVEVTAQPDGAFVGTLEIGVLPATTRDADHQEELVALRAEVLTLRARVAELEERLLAM
jgi:hypothetical protein